MERQIFDDDFVTKLKGELTSAPPARKKLTKADVLRSLAPTFRKLRDEKGYTLETLVILLNAKGLDVKVSTLQSALKRRGEKKAKATPVVAKPDTKEPLVAVVPTAGRSTPRAANGAK